MMIPIIAEIHHVLPSLKRKPATPTFANAPTLQINIKVIKPLIQLRPSNLFRRNVSSLLRAKFETIEMRVAKICAV